MLPGEDGLSICRRLRAANDLTPIIMFTAKVEDVDRIVGLEVGADDYLPKPFNPRELLARIHAVLRRRPARRSARRAGARRPDGHFRPVRIRPRAASAFEGRRADRAHHWRVLDAEGAGPPSAPTALARQARTTRPRPRVRALRPEPRPCRSRACGRCSSRTRRNRAISRLSGASAMCSSRTAPPDMKPPRSVRSLPPDGVRQGLGRPGALSRSCPGPWRHVLPNGPDHGRRSLSG